MKKRSMTESKIRKLLTSVLLPALMLTALMIVGVSYAQDDTKDVEAARPISPLTDPNMPSHFDARTDVLARGSSREVSRSQQKALQSLANKLGGDDYVNVTYNGMTNTPSRLQNPHGYLTEPSSEAAETIARDFIRQYAGLFRFTNEEIENLKLRSRAVTQEGTTIMVFQQMRDGVPVYQGEIMVNVNKSGQIVNVGGMSYPEMQVAGGFAISPSQAVMNAVSSMNVAYDLQPAGEAKILTTYGDLKAEYASGERFARNGGISDDINVQKVIFPLGSEGRAAYKFVLTTPQYQGIMWQIIIDAASGELLQRLSLTAFQNEPGGGLNNSRRGTFRPDVQNMVESYYQASGGRGRVFDTTPATLSGIAGVGRAVRTGTAGNYTFGKPTFDAEVDTNRFRYSMFNVRNEGPNYFNATGTQSFTEAMFPSILGQVVRGLPDATYPTSSSPFGWFYLPTGPNGSEITLGDSNRAVTRISGYVMSTEAQTRNLPINSPTGSGSQPFSADVTALGAPKTLNDGRVLNSVIQSRYTEGNNVSVSDDRENDNNSTRGIKGYATGRNFTDARFNYLSSYELGGVNASGGGTGSTTPVTYPASANPDVYPGTVSLFYFNNVEHDYLYSVGFTESMWNFQFDNFGKGGAGGDAIFAEVQDGSGTNNANMGTPDEGASPRMQMFLFTDGGFRRSDGDFDWDVIAHEHYHGVSNRSAGKGSTSCLGTPLVGESGGMGEGWSDFIASSMSDDDSEGEHVTGDQDRGIRRIPYTNYRYSYGSINDVNLNVRKNANTDIIGPDGNPGGIPYEVHDIGEVWAAVLWDMRELLIVKQKVGATYPGIFFDGTRRMGSGSTFYIGDRAVQSVDSNHPINYRQGFATDDGTTTPSPSSVLPKLNASDVVRPALVAAENAVNDQRSGPLATAVANGARLADKITLRGLQLVACNPSFVDIRNAMIAADREITGGENVSLIWRAFTSHGIGQNATSSNSGVGGAGAVVEDFTIPTTVSACELNGPLTNPSFTLANTTANTVTVSISSVAGAADYVIQRANSASGPFATIATQAGTSYNDTTVNSGNTYYYQVHARRNADCVGRANTQSIAVTVGTSPVVSPVFFGAESITDPQNGSSLTVNWTAATSANPLANIVYDVYRVSNVTLDNDLAAPTFVPATTNRIAQNLTGTSYSNVGLTTGQQYYYIVQARDTNNGQTDTNNLGNTKAVVGAPVTAAASSQIFALENFETGAANSRFNPALQDSATPNTGTPVFQRVPNAVLSFVTSTVMYAPDFDPADSGQGAPSNFATLIGPLTLTRGAILEFDHRYTTEATFDGGNVEVVLGTASVDPADATPFPNNSTTFELNDYLIQGAYNGPLNGTLEGAAMGSPLQGRRAWNGTGAYSHVRAALGDFAPGGARNANSLPVYVRFHSSSDVGSNAGVGSGWFIDNVVVNNFNQAAAAVTISGTITTGGNPLSGVSVALSGTTSATATTNASGQYTFNATSGGNYLVTPTLSGYNFDPQSRNYVAVTSNVTTADFTAYSVGTNPRALTVVNTFGTPTQPVTVPVVLNSQGNESGLTFSLTYNSSILSNPSVACGTDSGSGCALAVNSNTPGQIGVSVDPVAATYAAGTREVIRVTFNTAATTASSTPVGFSDTPARRETSDTSANPLPTSYVGGYVIFAQGIEADVVGRPTGNGTVSATDVSQIRNFAVGLDLPFDATSNEFQRADCAPYPTFGNGSIAATDVTQARRYQIGSDPSQPAAGPTGPASFAPFVEGEKTVEPDASVVAAPRAVRVVDATTSPGRRVTVTFLADAVGDENNYGFSISYDRNVLSNPLVTIGADSTGGNVLANASTMPGKIGFSVDFGGGTMPAGSNRRLVTVRFDVASNAQPGTSTPLAFVDQPALRETSNPAAQPVATDYFNGVVNILAPTAANVSVGGRVLDNNGNPIPRTIVSITNSAGQTLNAMTNGFGYYRFDGVGSGETYVISASHKQYTFAARTVTLADSVEDMDLTPTN